MAARPGVLKDNVSVRNRTSRTLGNLLNPPPPDPNVPRVAHLYPTGVAGARIAYAYLPDWDAHAAYDAVADTPPFAGRVRDSIRLATQVDALFIHNDARPRRRGGQPVSPMEHALRFLRARELVALIVLGDPPAPGEAEKAERLGYPCRR